MILKFVGIFIKEIDIAAYTISTVDDPRTLNKVLYLRPPGNIYSMNELVDIREHKIGKQLEKIYVSEDNFLNKIKGNVNSKEVYIWCLQLYVNNVVLKQNVEFLETPYPDKWELVFIYAAFVNGFQTCFEVEASGGVEGSVLYPHLKYTTVSTYLDTLL